MSKTIYIFGAGPTGLSLAWLLSKEKENKIIVIEKYVYGGGTWTTRWKSMGDNKLFTQHSPQILNKSYVNVINLWSKMGINYEDFTKSIESEWIAIIRKNTTFGDKYVFVKGYMMYIFNKKYYETVTVKEYLKSKLSEEGYKIITTMCYLLDGVSPDIMTVAELFGSFDQTYFYDSLEMTKASDDEGGFATLWINKLKENNVEFRFGTEINNIFINSETNNVGAVVNGNEKIEGMMILALDPLSLEKVLSKSDNEVKNNWGKWEGVSKHIKKGIYKSISVQYHFVENSKIKISNETNIGYNTEWNIICDIIPLTISKIPVLSCAVLDMEAFSSKLNKKVYECNPNEVKEEIWRQIKQKNIKLIEYFDSTVGEDIIWKEGVGWSFNISSACRTVLGPINAYGIREDIAIVGPLNYRIFKPTSMEAAVESALRFVGKKVKTSRTLSSIIKFVMYMVVIIVVIIIIIKLL